LAQVEEEGVEKLRGRQREGPEALALLLVLWVVINVLTWCFPAVDRLSGSGLGAWPASAL